MFDRRLLNGTCRAKFEGDRNTHATNGVTSTFLELTDPFVTLTAMLCLCRFIPFLTISVNLTNNPCRYLPCFQHIL
jgi:hypothetical protein